MNGAHDAVTLLFCHYYYRNQGGDDKVWYIILGSILTLGGSLVVHFFNASKEKKRLIGSLKSEIVGICDKAIKLCSRTEFYKIKACATLRLYQLLGHETELKKLADNYIDRQMDSLMDVELIKGDLLRTLTELYNYIDNSEIQILKEKYTEFDKCKFRTFDFKDCSDADKTREVEVKFLDNLGEYIMKESFGKPLKEIEKNLSPHL